VALSPSGCQTVAVSDLETLTALLVIDMQEAVLAKCTDVAGVISRINELAARARQAGAAVIFIQNEDVGDPDMTAGAAGWELDAALSRSDNDIVLTKTYRDAFAETDLPAILAHAGAQRLILTGAHTDFCVLTTALSAVFRGFDITLVSDAHTARAHTLPTGDISPETIIAFINSRLSTLVYPGRIIKVMPAGEVAIASAGPSLASRSTWGAEGKAKRSLA
jgi:hypothetical protein